MNCIKCMKKYICVRKKSSFMASQSVKNREIKSRACFWCDWQFLSRFAEVWRCRADSSRATMKLISYNGTNSRSLRMFWCQGMYKWIDLLWKEWPIAVLSSMEPRLWDLRWNFSPPSLFLFHAAISSRRLTQNIKHVDTNPTWYGQIWSE